ncbi:hypothetical protein SLS53_008463 [Cytospora paraplurivora]|uniref:Mitotic checkpoint regulator, MAD2B-interacting-domain-containing protein n=1 Tax=Cytospora paraplurivora TaxID=2898453 RepID=A0AAN9U082_9PEZI
MNDLFGQDKRREDKTNPTSNHTDNYANRTNRMGLVEYSDSESDGDSPSVSAAPPKPAASQSATKQPFQRLVDKANPGKILVNLPSASSSAADEATQSGEDNPAKRRKIGAGGSGGGGGGGRFGGFSSFLPPPKATAIARPSGGGSGSSGGKAAAPRVGVNLRTSSEAAFSRDDNGGGDGALAGEGNNSAASTGLRLPAPKASAQPSIPEGQKPAEEVKLVGKPLMFKPLSVARKPAKKSGGVNAAPPKAAGAHGTTASSSSTAAAPHAHNEAVQAAAPSKKKVSLFSVTDDTTSTSEAVPGESAPYEPEFTSYDNDSAFADAYPPYDAYQHQQQQQQYTGYAQQIQPPTYPGSDPSSLDAIADDLNLSAKARRELFGRGGAAPGGGTASSVINFNLDQEYRHNEELRASGALDQQQHNPLRAIKPGKHSLQQLVNQVQGQRDALEENFAKNRATQKSAGAKYGFR